MVIGGAGFIGSHLVDRLLADGTAVDVVDDLSTGGLANLADARSVGGSLKIHHLDAGTSEAASLIGMRTPDVLYHLAAIPRGEPSSAQLARSLAMTMSVLDAARTHRVAKVVVTLPATAMYGHPATRDLPLKELPLEPRGVRGVVARTIVDLLNVYREADALEFTVLALTSVYGPRQPASGGVVAALQAAAAERAAPVVTGDGRQTRDFLFVDDAVDAVVRAGDRGSGLVINVGTGEQTSVRELWTAIAGASGKPPQFRPSNSDEVSRFAVSPIRARIHLSWSPWTTLADGLSQTR